MHFFSVLVLRLLGRSSFVTDAVGPPKRKKDVATIQLHWGPRQEYTEAQRTMIRERLM